MGHHKYEEGCRTVLRFLWGVKKRAPKIRKIASSYDKP